MTSDTSAVFRTTYTHAPKTIIAAREFKPSIARTPCEVQNAAAVQTVRHAALKSTCTTFGRVCVFQSDCTSAPPRPISTVSPKLNKAMPARMKTKFVEIVVLKPGRRIFIVEASSSLAIAPNNGVAPNHGVTPDHRVTPNYGIAPNYRIAPDHGVTPNHGVAPNYGVIPDRRGIANE